MVDIRREGVDTPATLPTEMVGLVAFKQVAPGVYEPVLIESAGGAAKVWDANGLPPGNQHIREYDALDATVRMFDWVTDTSIPNGICAAAIWVFNEAEAAAPGEVAAVAIDPPDATVAATWLTAGSNLTGATERILVKSNTGIPEVFVFRDADGNMVGIDYIAMKRDIGADALRVVILGVEAPE